jgi:hypothetical protein
MLGLLVSGAALAAVIEHLAPRAPEIIHNHMFRGEVIGTRAALALAELEIIVNDYSALTIQINAVRGIAVPGEVLDPATEAEALSPSRATTLGLRWLVQYSRARREKTMVERLTNELLDASNGLGAAVKRREDTHKMAESNRAFAHYRW